MFATHDASEIFAVQHDEARETALEVLEDQATCFQMLASRD